MTILGQRMYLSMDEIVIYKNCRRVHFKAHNYLINESIKLKSNNGTHHAAVIKIFLYRLYRIRDIWINVCEENTLE